MKIVTVETQEYMRAHLFPVRRMPKGRGGKRKPSSEIQQRYNEKQAQHKLSDRVEANFTPEDFMITLTYDDAHLPQDADGALKVFAAYIRRLRRDMARAGTNPAELKYINIIQQGRKGGRLHHHVFLRAPGLDARTVSARWGQGHAEPHFLEFNEEGVRGLVGYVLEGRATVKRWTCSQNLREPVVRDHGSNAISAKDVRRINDNPTDFDYIEKFFPGWKVARTEANPGNPDLLGLFVTVYLYRPDNAYFRYDRYGRIDYSFKRREK